MVGVLHPDNDPPDVLRRLNGTVGTFESLDDRKEGFPGVDPRLDGFI
ncbi:hypothetical protein [Halorubrum saccharovorum]|nr:hypothetical protein [Halorubrum saccharovorum]